ncbi:hypothetical protein O181_107489 [Austropuccinia psidii MF-1]|uniref:Uncharacterized protein n=1 Tax=Austropuccinia psidii MF-1 TaxID=1389203 RepID=A0A9Q3JU54_9BASI|nr:hypothetical protein [Austropuccinia psidii MF-1]
MYLDLLVFYSFNQITAEEKSIILSASKESIPSETEIKSKAKDPEEDKFKVEDSEAIEKIKEELKKMRRNLYMAIEDPEKWLALKLGGMNKEDEGGSPQKKSKMDLKPPKANSSVIAEDYFSLLQEETMYISDTEKYLLYQQNNGNWEDKYKQGGIFEDLEEGELSENTQRLAGLSILEEFNDSYDQICCFSSSTDLFNQNKGITSGLPNDSQNQNGIQEDIPEYEGEENYVILPMITFEALYDYELDSPIIQTKYLSELPGSNLKNVDFLELLTTIGIKGNLRNPYWKKPYGYYQLTIEGLYHKMLWTQEEFNLDGFEILGGTLCWCDFGYMFIHEVKGSVSEWKGNTQRE